MAIQKQKLQVLVAFATLALLAVTVACTGFFVNPTLTSITVGPSNQSIAPAATLQMTATGTFDDGSTGNVTGKASWQSSDGTVATVGTNTGLVTAAQTIANPPGTVTITASVGTISNTATVTVCPTVTKIDLTASPTTQAAGQAVTFTAKATFSGSGTQQDVTDNVTWSISNTSVIPSITAGSGTVSTSATSGSTTNVTASLCGGTSNIVTITVQ